MEKHKGKHSDEFDQFVVFPGCGDLSDPIEIIFPKLRFSNDLASHHVTHSHANILSLKSRFVVASSLS